MSERALKKVEINRNTDIVALAEEVQRTNEGRVLQRGDEDVAVLMPVQEDADAYKTFTQHDPLFSIIGMASSGEPHNISEDKYTYLADAYDND